MHAYLEGNNGGDYLLIEQDEEQKNNSTMYMEVGSCCVVTMKAVVPVEFITALISKFCLTKSDGFSRSKDDKLKDYAREVMDWNEDYVNELCSKIQEAHNGYSSTETAIQEVQTNGKATRGDQPRNTKATKGTQPRDMRTLSRRFSGPCGASDKALEASEHNGQ